jgi:hypothetical protein
VQIARPLVGRSRPAWQIGATLAWCAALGVTFVRDERVPVLGLVDLGFHELGHLVMYLVPISELLTAAMGSVLQCAVPLGLAGYFLAMRHDRLAAAVCLAWAATSLRDASVYVADAPHERLELIGGEHDWAFVLGSDGLDRLHQAGAIAGAIRGTGAIVLAAAVVLVAVEVRNPSLPERRARTRRAGTGARPGDPSPSR